MPILHELFRHRWSVPIIAELHARGGCRFAELAGRLGVSRDVLSQTLGWLVTNHLARRNPGYGHPMRPEYLPTPEANRIGEACASVLTEARRLDAENILLRRWSCPTLDALRQGPARFSELRAALGEITPRALSQCLVALEDAGLIIRSVGDERPPSVTYALAPPAIPLAELLKGLR